MAKPTDLSSERRAGTEPAPVRRAEIEAFLAEARARRPVPARGRLIFAIDATLSRQPTWDLACDLQAGMFDAAARAGGLAVQLVYYRGHGEARASRWVDDAAALKRLMTGLECRGGRTQIGRVLDHALAAAAKAPVAALAFVGDAVEENADLLADRAGALALRGTRAFVFHEGGDPGAGRVLREIARLTGGAYLPFDARAAAELGALLAAVATFAAGGRPALEAAGSAASRRLLADLGP